MKGQLEAVYNTALLTIVLGILVIGLLLIWGIQYIRTGDPRSSQSFELVIAQNKPFSVAEGLLFSRFNDRTIKEHLLEAGVVESLSGSKSAGIEERIKEIMEFYNLKYYLVKLEKGDKTILEIDNTLRKCGSDEQGICVTSSVRERILIRDENKRCGIARKKIDDDGKCRPVEVCCEEEMDSNKNYPSIDSQGRKVITCGPDRKGVCDFKCKEGRMFLPGAEGCPVGEPSLTPVFCCLRTEEAAAAELGSLNRAEIPLLYKKPSEENLFPVSYCVNSDKVCIDASGEPARGLCDTGVCCVTSLIQCETPLQEKGFCLDVKKCGEIGGLSKSSDKCPKSTTGTFQCCIGGDTGKIKTRPNPLSKTSLGRCNFPQVQAEEDTSKFIVVIGEK